MARTMTYHGNGLTKLVSLAPGKSARLAYDARSPVEKAVARCQRKGFTPEATAAFTGLRKGQVQYRFSRKTGFSWMRFRRGETPEAQRIMKRIEAALLDLHRLKKAAKKALHGRRKRGAA